MGKSVQAGKPRSFFFILPFLVLAMLIVSTREPASRPKMLSALPELSRYSADITHEVRGALLADNNDNTPLSHPDGEQRSGGVSVDLAFIESMAESFIKRAANTVRSASVDPAWAPLLARLEADGMERTDLDTLFARLGPESWTPAFMAAKVTELYGVKGITVSVEESLRPQLPEGYETPLSSVTAKDYREFIQTYAAELKDIRQRFGVPAPVLVGLLLVETGLGSNLGSAPALLSLASMASTHSPEILAQGGNEHQAGKVKPARLKVTLQQKSDWAYTELRALIQYSLDNNVDVSAIPGSVYGAVGICQFMPSNIAAYGIDGDKDGIVDLFSVVDAMYSAANYLSSHGWQGAKSRSRQVRTLMAYNKDQRYADKVLGVANNLALAEKGKLADHRNPLAGLKPSKGRKQIVFSG